MKNLHPKMSRQNTVFYRGNQEIKIDFSYSEKTVRTIVDNNNQVLFVAKDVANVLGIKWRGVSTLRSIPEKWRGVHYFRTPQVNQHKKEYAQEQELITITESAVYMLAFRSNKKEAVKFTEWVTGEVLPQIRQYGKYEPQRALAVNNTNIILQKMMTITNFGYRCKKELEQPMNIMQQMHVFTRFVNIAGFELAGLQAELAKYYQNPEAQNYYLNNAYNPFVNKNEQSLPQNSSEFDPFNNDGISPSEDW